MQRALFAQRLIDAATFARDFARRYVVEQLPDAMIFDVQLNASFDGDLLHADELVFPEDRGRVLLGISAEEAVALLWRASRVPEWIDVNVIAVDADRTRLEMISCGRFTSNAALLYHQQEGRAPFHAVSPALPPGWTEGQRFSLASSPRPRR